MGVRKHPPYGSIEQFPSEQRHATAMFNQWRLQPDFGIQSSDQKVETGPLFCRKVGRLCGVAKRILCIYISYIYIIYIHIYQSKQFFIQLLRSWLHQKSFLWKHVETSRNCYHCAFPVLAVLHLGAAHTDRGFELEKSSKNEIKGGKNPANHQHF